MLFKKKDKKADKSKSPAKNLKHFFRKEGEIDISFHWKLALVVFFFVGMAVVLLCIFVFFNIGQRSVFVDSGSGEDIKNINKERLDRVIEAYELRADQFETAKGESVSIPSTVESVPEPSSEISESESAGEEPQAGDE